MPALKVKRKISDEEKSRILDEVVQEYIDVHSSVDRSEDSHEENLHVRAFMTGVSIIFENHDVVEYGGETYE